MVNIMLGLKLMGYGLVGIFLALILFYLMIKAMLGVVKGKSNK